MEYFVHRIEVTLEDVIVTRAVPEIGASRGAPVVQSDG
jgi:hypothetical protein